MTPQLLRRAPLLALLLCAWASGAAACPVCYGEPGSSATQGMTAAIISLLGVTGGVLAAFGTMFLRLRRRARLLAGKETAAHG
ncbi:MAG TPA: hypothetical protein VL221_00840 [Bacteroidota bacterium]|nr:hypothetical protein [Bacteroidota bacterium]